MKIDAQDIAGSSFTIDLSGLPARVFQHEFDHLKVTFFLFNCFGQVVFHLCSKHVLHNRGSWTKKICG